MQIPLKRGRWFANSDTATTQRVAVIDDVLARAYWPRQDPLGKRIRFGSHDPWAQVIGIVAHTRRDSHEVDENKGVVYKAFAQQPVEGATFVARSANDAESWRTPMADTVHAADGAEALYDVTPLSALVEASLAPRHLLVWMLSLFGGLALFLAAIGIYGLLSFLATQRTVEVGVRMALGANRIDIAYLIARRIVPLLVTGLAVGVVLVIIAQRTLTHFFAAMSAAVSPPSQAQQSCCCSPRWWPRSCPHSAQRDSSPRSRYAMSSNSGYFLVWPIANLIPARNVNGNDG
jgi:hypothetical protein